MPGSPTPIGARVPECSSETPGLRSGLRPSALSTPTDPSRWGAAGGPSDRTADPGWGVSSPTGGWLRVLP